MLGEFLPCDTERACLQPHRRRNSPVIGRLGRIPCASNWGLIHLRVPGAPGSDCIPATCPWLRTACSR